MADGGGVEGAYPGSFEILGHPGLRNSSSMEPSARRVTSPTPGT
jgi:hypothetical protein